MSHTGCHGWVRKAPGAGGRPDPSGSSLSCSVRPGLATLPRLQGKTEQLRRGRGYPALTQATVPVDKNRAGNHGDKKSDKENDSE